MSTLSSYFKNFSPIEIAVLAVFIIYIVFPIKTPNQFGIFIDHPFGIVILFAITLYLFFYTNPVLGVVFLLVAYELLRRSSLIVARYPIIEYVPSEKKRMQEMVLMNPPNYTTLEEEIVAQRGPIDVSRPIIYDKPTFKPVAENVGSASLI
jgi:hypothetical protein